MPTEAEWEYACRGGTTTAYCFGDTAWRLGEYAWYNHNAYDIGDEYAHKVRQKRANSFGLHDMHGNVNEWCSDWFGKDYYGSSPLDDPTGPATGLRRVVRGGSWDRGAKYCQSAYRPYDGPVNRIYFIGFRVALVPAQ